MSKINLSMDSRIISHLGEALISDEKIALLELIKNSSDADALNCNIEIDTRYESPHGIGKIVLEDDGNGMTPYIIEHAFLRIATSFKSSYQKESPIYKRIALGSKGIGRLSLNQLGSYVEVETKMNTEVFNYVKDLKGSFGTDSIVDLIESNNEYYYKFVINWMDFNNSNLRLEDVDINLQKISAIDKYFCKNSNHGTKITVYGLKGISFWEHRNTKKDLEKDVLSFINPYLSQKYNFKVKINLNREIFRNDTYDKKRIENISDVTSKFYFSSKEKKIIMEVKRNPQYIRNLIENLLERMDEEEFELLNKEVNYQEYYEIFGKDKVEIILDPISLSKSFSQANTNSLFTNDKGEYLLPGDFEGSFYGFNRESKKTEARTEVKNLLDNISGVKMYRNNFRVFPYGEKDWLEFGKISQTQISNIYRPNNTTGYVYIDGEENLTKLRELTNREGIIQDKYGRNFIIIMKDVVAKLAAVLDNNLRSDLNIKKTKRNTANAGTILSLGKGSIEFVKKEDPISKTEINFKSLKREITNGINDLKSENNIESYEKKISNLSKMVDKNFNNLSLNLNEINEVKNKKSSQIENEKEYISKFYPVIGATIIAETLSHEIIRLSNNIKFSSLEIRNLLSKNILQENIETMVSHLNIIDSNTKFLNRYASLLDVNSYSKRRKYEIKELKTYSEETFKESPLLKYRDISVNLEVNGTGFEQEIVKEGFNIIIENLVINSVYWLEKMKIEQPCIYLEFNGNSKTIRFWDNGFGIHPNISDNLFEPFRTNKPQGEGRGMGLFIVKELLKEIKGDIVLLPNTNADKNKYIFEIGFSGE